MMPEPHGWSLAGLVRAAVIAAISIGVGAGMGYLIAHEPGPGEVRPQPVEQRPASAVELALVAPLGPGVALADFVVTEILPVSDAGALRVVCERGDVGVALDVALAAEGGPAPPAVTGRYAIYYTLRGATPAEGERLAVALAAVLRQHEAAAIPPGLGVYHPGSPRPAR